MQLAMGITESYERFALAALESHMVHQSTLEGVSILPRHSGTRGPAQAARSRQSLSDSLVWRMAVLLQRLELQK